MLTLIMYSILTLIMCNILILNKLPFFYIKTIAIKFGQAILKKGGLDGFRLRLH